jgi:hypothetical protein
MSFIPENRYIGSKYIKTYYYLFYTTLSLILVDVCTLIYLSINILVKICANI